MFNIGSGELILIAVVALLVLGPKRLPELARGLGRFLREFRRQTDEVRGVVEREFYKMDQEMDAAPPAVAAQLAPATDVVAQGLPAGAEHAMESDMPMDHSDPRHPDYGKPDPAVEAEDPALSHHTDPTPAHVASPAVVPAAATPATDSPQSQPVLAPVADPEKKAS